MNTPVPLFDTLQYFKDVRILYKLPDFAESDYSAAKSFLYEYRKNEDTFNAYRREVERLLQWAWQVSRVSIFDIKRADFESFIEFCKNPPSEWIGAKVERYQFIDGLRIPNPDWRPFIQSGLADASIEGIFRILSSFYNFLLQEKLITINPVKSIRQKSKYFRKEQESKQIKRLSNLQLQYVFDAAEDERTVFILQCLFSMYLRISELVESDRWRPKMSDFFRDAKGRWWFKTVGKGNKLRNIAVNNAVLGSLKVYRKSRDLSALPFPTENVPLIAQANGKAITTTRAIRKIVQKCFNRAIVSLSNDRLFDEAAGLCEATVHWLRHTGISEDVKVRPREHVRDDAGHSSSLITDRYINIELDERHESKLNRRA